MRNRRRMGRYAFPQQRMWLEVAGQQRLRRLHRQLAARREFLKRWSALLDDVDRDVSRRLSELGTDQDGYDTELDDVNEPARDYYANSKLLGQDRRKKRHGLLHGHQARAWVGADDEDDNDDDEEFEEMSKPAIETYYENGTWHSRRQGSSRAFAAGGTKAEQVAKGRDAARKDKTEHIIKNRDGSISERNSYGGDPHPPEG